jgi:cytochrome c oxidase accessory protein FixG
MYDEETVQTIYNTGRGGNIYSEDQETKLVNSLKELKATEPDAECTMCDSCVRVCPTHIDIKRGMQLECINCLECADACTKVMGALGKESLITWTSYSAVKENRKPKLLRFRTIAYGVALTAALIGLLVMGSKKENMLLNINRTTQLYKIKDNGNRVNNAYIFLFQNTQRKDHTYYFEVVGHPDIKIARPAKPFKLRAGKKAKKVVVLYTKKQLVKNAKKDTPIDIVIKAYAVDDKEKIVVQRNTTFVYPRLDLIQKAQGK